MLKIIHTQPWILWILFDLTYHEHTHAHHDNSYIHILRQWRRKISSCHIKCWLFPFLHNYLRNPVSSSLILRGIIDLLRRRKRRMQGRRVFFCFFFTFYFFRDRLSKRETKREEIDDQLPEQEDCSSKPAEPSGGTCVCQSAASHVRSDVLLLIRLHQRPKHPGPNEDKPAAIRSCGRSSA